MRIKHPKTRVTVTQSIRLLALALCILVFSSLLLGAQSIPVSNSQEPIETNIWGYVSIGGTVRQACSGRSHLILENESGPHLIEFANPITNDLRGHKVHIEGISVFSQDTINLQPIEVVDNNGVHGVSQQSGSVYLKAGHVPFKVLYFNHLGEMSLTLTYEGPGVSLRPITSVYKLTNGISSTTWSEGFRYSYFEGEWINLPDFSTLPPVKTGTIAKLDFSMRNRKENFAVEFSGYLDVLKDGQYTFYLSSDDGSKLVIGDSQVKIEDLGPGDKLPPPKSIVLGQKLDDKGKASWVTVEGLVTFAGQSQGVLTMDLSSITGQIKVEMEDAPPGLQLVALGSRVRISGLCHAITDDNGVQVAGHLHTLNAEDFHITSISLEKWHQVPIRPVSNSVPLLKTHQIVQMEGTIIRKTPDPIRFEDKTGWADVICPSRNLVNQTNVSLIGYWISNETKPVFRCLDWCHKEDTETGALVTLTTVESVRNLSQKAAARSFPVKIRGIRTHEDETMGMIQDETGGIFVWEIPGNTHLGDYIEIEGISDPGGFAPGIKATKCRYLGTGPFPPPLHPTWEELMSGALDSQWVEIKGLVVLPSDSRHDIIVSMNDGDVVVSIMFLSEEERKRLEGTVIRVRGVVFCDFDSTTRQMRSGYLRIHDMTQVTIETPRLDNFAAVPIKSVSDLLTFDPSINSYKPQKVAGIIIGINGSNGILLDGTNGLKFQLRKRTAMHRGDTVEVMGFPGLSGKTPLLRNAILHRIRSGSIPKPASINVESMGRENFDARLVQIEGRLMNFASNGSEQILEMEIGTKLLTGRLPYSDGKWPNAPLGSRLQLKGVLTSVTHNKDAVASSFEMLINSPSDIQTLETPSWWNVVHTVIVIITLLIILLIALVWILSLRHNVAERTRQLVEKIELHKRTEVELKEKTLQLKAEIEERKQLETEKERTHKELMIASRQAGMAEVATGVLHNVGNVLNSVNVSTSILGEKVRASKTANIAKLSALLNEHEKDLGDFLLVDEKGRKIPSYLSALSTNINGERQEILKEIDLLRDNVNHIREIVAMQQNFARISSVSENIFLGDIIDDIFKMQSSSFAKYEVQLESHYDDVPLISTDKHRVMQILVNLLQNARQACVGGEEEVKKVTVRLTRSGEDKVRIDVTDNGIGIKPENMTKIFVHGFTTKKDGHGFGLHSGALSAKALGGSLSVTSDGPGKGATFTLELPLTPQKSSAPPAPSKSSQ